MVGGMGAGHTVTFDRDTRLDRRLQRQLEDGSRGTAALKGHSTRRVSPTDYVTYVHGVTDIASRFVPSADDHRSGRAKTPGFTRRQVHAARLAVRLERRADAKAEKRQDREWEREWRLSAAMLEGCADA